MLETKKFQLKAQKQLSLLSSRCDRDISEVKLIFQKIGITHSLDLAACFWILFQLM